MCASDLAVREAVFLEIPLVILLGSPERRCGDDLGDDRAAEAAALLQTVPGLRSRLLLVGVVEEDRGPILRSDVRALAVLRRRVVVLPENVEETVVGHSCRIELDLNRLGVTGSIRADVLVGRIRELSPRVT